MDTTIDSYAPRPRTLAPWGTSVPAGTAMASALFVGPVGVEAGVLGADVRNGVALQGEPPRENPR